MTDGEESGGERSARIRDAAETVAEAVVRNYQGVDPELPLSSLAEFLKEKGEEQSEFAELVEKLREILRQRAHELVRRS